MSVSTRIGRIAPALVGALAVAVCVFQATARGDEHKSIVVVTSRDGDPYQSVVAGIRDSLAGHGGGVLVTVRSLESSAREATEALSVARAKKGGAPLITVGSAATRAALEAEGQAPVIACMIVNAKGLKGTSNATGVVLEFPVETQLRWMKRFVPKGQSIGVLYNPEENREQIVAAERAARRLGLRLVARKIDRPQALPDALKSLAREADVLWGVTDQLVLAPQTAEAILLFSFRNRIPFAGLSASWVRAGALYALDRDYVDLGAQCGEMAREVLNGKRAGSLPPAAPRKVTYALNLRTAEHLKIEFPRELIEGAEHVFR